MKIQQRQEKARLILGRPAASFPSLLLGRNALASHNRSKPFCRVKSFLRFSVPDILRFSNEIRRSIIFFTYLVEIRSILIFSSSKLLTY